MQFETVSVISIIASLYVRLICCVFAKYSIGACEIYPYGTTKFYYIWLLMLTVLYEEIFIKDLIYCEEHHIYHRT